MMNIVYTSDSHAVRQCDNSTENDAIAQIINGSNTELVTSVGEMVAAVEASGNTRIKLLKDIISDTEIVLPYSCMIDCNQFIITVNTACANGIRIKAAGIENQTTIIQNGMLIHNMMGIQVEAGAIVISNMEIRSLSGACVGIFDVSAEYKTINRIESSKLSSAENGCIIFNQPGADFSQTGITVDRSTLINYKKDIGRDFGYLFALNGAKPGAIIFGENVALYSYKEIPMASKYARYGGILLSRVSNDASVTVGDTTYIGLTQWSSNAVKTGIKILAIGNSFCYSHVEELYGMARANGRELFLTNLYYAGCSVEQHWDWLNHKIPNYEYWITCSAGRFIYDDIKTVNDALAFVDWQIITLQQHFSPEWTVDHATAYDSCTPYAKNLYDHIKEKQPQAKLYWHQTWAFAVGYPTASEVKKIPNTARQTLQYECIRYASDLISRENKVELIPCGDAWQNARADSLIGDTLCKADRVHDGYEGGGQYLNACVWYETLFGESCVGNAYRPQNCALSNYEIAEEKLMALQKAAHRAVADIYGEDHTKQRLDQ